jgi:electron transfer flavoprotein beta subunit
MALNIIVCTKAVPGYIMNPEVSESGDRVNYKAGSIIMNESDEYALQEAVALKKASGGEVTVITAGSLSSQKALQTGLAKDADKAIRIDADLFDPGSIARMLAEAIKGLEYDLILTGVESGDLMGAQVGVAVAELLGLPFAYAVTEVSPGEGDGILKVTKELGRGVKQIVEMTLPALLCMQTGTTPLSFVPFRKMAQAQSKPMKTLGVGDLGLGEDTLKSSSRRIVEAFSPQKRAKAEIITGSPSEVVSVFFTKIKEVM